MFFITILDVSVEEEEEERPSLNLFPFLTKAFFPGKTIRPNQGSETSQYLLPSCTPQVPWIIGFCVPPRVAVNFML